MLLAVVRRAFAVAGGEPVPAGTRTAGAVTPATVNGGTRVCASSGSSQVCGFLSRAEEGPFWGGFVGGVAAGTAGTAASTGIGAVVGATWDWIEERV